MNYRLAITAVLCLTLLGCGPIDTLREGMAHSQAVSTALEKSTGLRSRVGFNWNNGSLTSVTVQFEGLPGNVPLADIAEKSQRAVLAEFKETPKNLVISFAIEPK